MEGFFKGLRSALIANGLQSAVYYYFYAFFKALHGVVSEGTPPRSAAALPRLGCTRPVGVTSHRLLRRVV